MPETGAQSLEHSRVALYAYSCCTDRESGGSRACQRWRRYRSDGQIDKKLKLGLEMMLEYFQWEQEICGNVLLADTELLCVWFAVVDGLGCYFRASGIPSHLAQFILKVARLYSPDDRVVAACACEWSLPLLRESAPLWKEMKPALRSALESASNGTMPDEAVTGRRKRART